MQFDAVTFPALWVFLGISGKLAARSPAPGEGSHAGVGAPLPPHTPSTARSQPGGIARCVTFRGQQQFRREQDWGGGSECTEYRSPRTQPHGTTAVLARRHHRKGTYHSVKWLWNTWSSTPRQEWLSLLDLVWIWTPPGLRAGSLPVPHQAAAASEPYTARLCHPQKQGVRDCYLHSHVPLSETLQCLCAAPDMKCRCCLDRIQQPPGTHPTPAFTPVPVLTSVWAPGLLPVAAASADLVPTGHSFILGHHSFHKHPPCLSTRDLSRSHNSRSKKWHLHLRLEHQVPRDHLVLSRGVTGQSSEGEISRSKHPQEAVIVKETVYGLSSF